MTKKRNNSRKRTGRKKSYRKNNRKNNKRSNYKRKTKIKYTKRRTQLKSNQLGGGYVLPTAAVLVVALATLAYYYWGGRTYRYPPDVPEPDVPEPDVSEPDVPEPDVPEPDVPEPDVSEPDVPEPDVPEPDVPIPRGDQRAATWPADLGEPPAKWLKMIDSINVLIKKLGDTTKEHVLIFKAASHGGILGPSSIPLPYNNFLLNWVAFGEKGYASSEALMSANIINRFTADSSCKTTSADEQSKIWAQSLISNKFFEYGVDNLKDTLGCLTGEGESFLKRILYSMRGWDIEKKNEFTNMELSLGIYRPGEQFNNMKYIYSETGMKLIFYFGVLGDPDWEEVILDYNCVEYFTGIDTTISSINTETIITNVNEKLLKGINEKRSIPLKFCWIPSTTCRVTSNLELDSEKYQLSRNISRRKNNSLECFEKSIKDEYIKKLFLEITQYAEEVEGHDIVTFQGFYKYLKSGWGAQGADQKKDELIRYIHINNI